MAILNTLPFRNDLPFYTFRITLSGVIYTLALNFNQRMNRWTMDINDASNNQILSGIPVLINRDLTGQYLYMNIAQGNFVATDDTGQDTQPTQFSFGSDHTMFYEDLSA